MLATRPARPVRHQGWGKHSLEKVLRQPELNYAAANGVLIVSPSKLTGRNKLVRIPLVHIPNDNTL